MSRKNEHIFRSKLPDIQIPNHLPIHIYCFQNLHNHRLRHALIDATSGKVFTHAASHLTARRVGAGLHNHGFRKGDTLMLLLHNSPQFVFAFLASNFIGAIVTTANPLYTAGEIANQVLISKPKLIITHARYIEKLNIDGGVKISTIDPPPFPNIIDFSDLMKSDEKSLPEVAIDSNETAAMLFSSGTTGFPKAVMLSHKNIVTIISQQVDGAVHIEPEDVSICVLPLFHTYSLNAILLSNLRAGSTVVVVPKFEINHVMEVIEKYRVTLASFVPPILLAMAKTPATPKYDLSSVRRVVCGAAPMDERLVASVKAKLPNAIIAQGYGMTEAGLVSISLGFAKIPQKFKPESCGIVMRNSLMKIVDPATGTSLPRNHPGEIYVKSHAVMKGYYTDPEATRQTIGDDGWLRTGDFGYVDIDDELFIVERLKELIKYKGFHVAPAEIEALLISHPSVSDAAVVSMKDESAGEVPVAFVVMTKGSNVRESEIKRFVFEKVISYKRIHRVFFIDDISKVPSGKILRKNLRSRF